MLSRFCGCSLKIVRLVQIAQSTNSHSLPALFLSHKSNYATAATNPNVTKTRNLEVIIKELKGRIENKSRLTKADFQSLLTKLESQNADSTQALEILRCCSYARVDQNQSTLIENIWEELKKQDDQLQIQHYNCMLQYARNKMDAEKAQQIFDEMVNAEIQPDVISYQNLLATYCKAGKIDKAIEILGMMDKDNLYINEGSFNNLVQCHIICGNLDAAEETLASLKGAGFKVNYYTLEALLRHHAKAGDLENIEKTLELFKEENVEPMNRDILRIVCNFAVNGHSDKIDPLLSHLKPTTELRRSLQNAITLFVEKKQSPIVPKILQSADGDVKEKVKHLIQEMVRLSTPESEFNETIANIEAMGITLEDNFDLFKPGLESSSEELIRRLLAHMKSRSIEVRETVFEKLFQLAAKKGVDEVLNVVNLMCSDFNIQPQITFVRDVILPGLNTKENPALAYAKLQGTKIRPRNVVLAIVNNSLNNGDIKTAHDFASSYNVFYDIEMIRRPLLRAFLTTGDISNFVAFVRLIHDSYSRINSYYHDKKYNETEIKEKQKTFVYDILYSALSNRRTETQLITQLLNSFIEEGLAISTSQPEQIQKFLKVDGETQIGRLLKRLSTEALKLRPVEVKRGIPNVMKQLSSTDVQNIMEVKQSQGFDSNGTERLLFLAHIRERNVTEIESLLANDRFKLNNSDYALLIDMHVRLGYMDKATSVLKQACDNNPSFRLDGIKVAKLVTRMIEKERKFDEIEAILKAHQPIKFDTGVHKFERLLYRLALNGNVNLVEKLYDALINYKYIVPTADTTAPLVLSHIKNGTYAEAVAKYEYVAQTYNFAPMTSVLFIELIKKNEIDLLQRAFDTFEKLNGEGPAMCRLAFAFIAYGQDRQARAILDNRRTTNLSRYIAKECKQYVIHKRIKAAKTLLIATKGLYCDRHIIYQTVLDIYVKENKAQEALDLWCDYSTEDGILPRPDFQNKLAKLLEANKMEMPDNMSLPKQDTSRKQSTQNLDHDKITN